MSKPILPLLIACALGLFGLPRAGAAASPPGFEALPPILVTQEVLEARITEADANPSLEGEARIKLVALYREALGNLKDANASSARAAAFAETLQTAPEQIRRIRGRIASPGDVAPPPVLDLDPQAPRGQIERRLNKELAELAAADARLADLERQLAYQEHRPIAIRQRLTAAQEQQDAIAASLQAEGDADLGIAPVQARRWGQETRYIALSTEIRALDQELLSLPTRMELIEAKRDQEAANAREIGRRIQALKARINATRETEAHEAKAAAERMLQETAELHPILRRLAERNGVLTDALNAIALQLDDLDEQQVQAERQAARIKADYRQEQAVKAVSGLTEGLGQLLLEHRASLPDFKVYDRKARVLERQIAAVNVSRLRHLDEAARFADPDRAVADSLAALPEALPPEVHGKLRDLVKQRQGLLAKQLEAEDHYLKRLRKLQTAEGEMLEAARAYDDFLKEHLFWLHTGARIRLTDFANLPDEVRRLRSPAPWRELGSAFADLIRTSPALWLALIASAALGWKRRALIALIEHTATGVGKAATDRYGSTLRALALTLASAAPLPLLVGVSGWQLVAAEQATDLSHAVGFSLVRVALTLYVFLVLRALCLPSGLAIGHFRWPAHQAGRLRRDLDWLIWVLVPALLVARLALDLNPVATGGLVTRLAMLVASVTLALVLFRVLHPRNGILAHLRRRDDAGLLLRTQPLWFVLLSAFPLLVLATILGGYVYSATIMASAYLFTLWLIVGLVVLHGLARRWLTLMHRRIAYRAATERRKAAAAARESGAEQTSADPPPEYAEVDFDAVTSDTRELLRIAVGLIGLGGLYLIWSPMLPALGILDEVTLWHHTATVDGAERRLPVSLADLGLASIYVVVMVLLAKRLPTVLDMILLARFQMTSGARYTATSLTTYAIVAVGSLLALNTLGAQWSQLQWLVAALGVGIGFGLQEIVANFISGLIILFERPVRVGDMVTVGNTDGVVTKIRIRATTIRDLERKELLVPNKEFITGRLLNWSLSDQITRLMVVVGVAYGTDVDEAHALMRAAAEEHEAVLDHPKPTLSFDAFGDNSLTLKLRAFTDDIDQRMAITTDLHKAIYRKFEQAGISIAFPQRDLHLDAREPLRVLIEAAGQPKPRNGEPG